jgi:RNA polymerase sigma-B factor
VAAPTLQSSRGPRRRRGDRRQRARAQAHERTLALRYHRHGDLAARRELVERFIPLARELALRYSYTDEPTDDLVQVASLGLLKAVDRYEPNRGSKFTSYAVPTILGELKRHFRDKGWALHMPRDLQERALAVSRATEKLSAALGRSPRLPEIAEELGCTVEAVLDAAEVADTWGALPEVEREVVRLRFACDLTQREIGERIGFSQMHVSRLLRRAVGRLRDSAAQAA